MSYGYPQYGSQLSSTPTYSCGPSMKYNMACSSSFPPSYNSFCSPDPSCCNQISKLASFAQYGGGNKPIDRCNQFIQQPQCLPYKNPAPIQPKRCCEINKKYTPPAFIDNTPRRGGNNKTPAERLRNVDVLEELCYYVPGQDPCCPTVVDCYNVCNCCGASEQVDCGCPGRQYVPPNPVKYSRRQRFTFQGQELKRNDFCNGLQWPFDRPCAEPSNYSSTNRANDDENPMTPCEKLLPPQTGIYYFNSKRKTFIPEKDMPKAPDVHYKTSSASKNRQPAAVAQQPLIEEYEILEEDSPQCEPEVVIQPIIQPIFMPNNPSNPPNNQDNLSNQCNSTNRCNPCCNPCYNPCNPCYNPCNPLGNNMYNGNGMNPCGPCIPMCIPMCPPQAPAPAPYYPPPPPPQQPMYPPMFPGMYPGMFPEKKHKKDKKKKKRKSKKKREETILDFEEEKYPSPTPTYVSPVKANSPDHYPNSEMSANIIVAGGPAAMYSGELPSGAYTETFDDGAVITTLTFPPGEAENVMVNATPSISRLESNIDVYADIGRSTSKAMGSQRGSPRSGLSPVDYQRGGDGTELTTYVVPEGQDATIIASNDQIFTPPKNSPTRSMRSQNSKR